MKQVHWQLPFAAISGTQYRVDIYDDPARSADGGQSWPIVLVGGAEPFVTDEDASDDFFAPVRAQKATIHIVNEDGLLTLDEMIPANNTDRPVRLVRIKDDGSEKVEWQGFLSCEVYSQDYTARPHDIALNANSVLGAMESVDFSLDWAGFKTIRDTIFDVMRAVDDEGGNVASLYFPVNGADILDKIIDTTVFVELHDQSNENSVVYTPKGISLNEAMVYICSFMGWTMREAADGIYFISADNSLGYKRYMREYLIGPEGRVTRYRLDASKVYETTNKPMGEMEYMGTGHTIDCRQGAKSVEVVASVKHPKPELGLPDVPYGDLTRKIAWLPDIDRNYPQEGNEYYYGAQIYASTNETAHSFIEFGYVSAVRRMNERAGYTNPDSYQDTTLSTVLDTMLINSRETTGHEPVFRRAAKEIGDHRFYAGAFYGRMNAFERVDNAAVVIKYIPEDTVLEGNWSSLKCTAPDPTDGVHMVFIPAAYSYDVFTVPVNNFDYSKTKPIFKMRSVIYYHLSNGYLNINASYIAFYQSMGLEDRDSDLVKHRADLPYKCSVGATLRFGNKWWNGNEWVNTPTQFRLKFQGGGTESNWAEYMEIDEVKGTLIPLDESMTGELELDIWADMSRTEDGPQAPVVEMFFKELQITYETPDNDLETDRAENHYYRLLGLKYKEEVSVKTDLASNLNNKPSPSIPMKDETKPITSVAFVNDDGSISNERPERRLLDRLEKHYSAPRHVVSLEAKRPDDAPLTMVVLNGFDNRKYLPLSESRNWRNEVSSIRCFENPE